MQIAAQTLINIQHVHCKLLSLYAGQSVNQLLQGGQLLLVNQLKLLNEEHKVLERGVEVSLLP